MSHRPHNLPPLRKYAGETIDAAAILDRLLASIGSGVTISSVSSTATVRDTDGAEVASGGPTVTSIARNAAEYTRPISGETYDANTVITYTIAGGTRGETYWIDFEVTPSAGSNPVIVRQPVVID